MANLVYAIIHETTWVIHCVYGLTLLIGMQIQSLFAEWEIKETHRECVIVADLLTVRLFKYGLFADFGALALFISWFVFIEGKKSLIVLLPECLALFRDFLYLP